MSQDNVENNIVINAYDGLINWLRRLFLSVRENIVLFILCIACGISLCILYNYSKSDKYTASFTVSYDELVRKIYGDRLFKINRLIRYSEFSKVANYLNIDTQTAKQLVEIKGKNILGEDLIKDMNTDRIPFTISFVVKDSSIIPKVQAGIVSFLEEGNAYSSLTKELKIREIEDEIQFVDKQLSMMDSLKKKYIIESSAVTDDKNSSLSSVYNFSYEMYKIKKDLVKKRNLPGNIHVIDDAIGAELTEWPTGFAIMVGVVIGFILFIFILLFIKPVLSHR